MDVLNMSIGDAYNNWPGTPTAAAASMLVKKGVVVVASIGNNGAKRPLGRRRTGRRRERHRPSRSIDNLKSTKPGVPDLAGRHQDRV